MQLGFFDTNKRYEQLNKLNDPLLVLSDLIDFEIFREEIEKGLKKERKNNSGRKPFDKVMLFKGNNSYYGYKDHINADVEYKLIRAYEVTPAKVHDSQPLENLIDESNDTAKLWADSAYWSEVIFLLLLSKQIEANINEWAYKNKPLTEEQKANNRILSKTRARVEHVFGFITNSLKGDFIRTIGIVRAKSQIAMINLTYNLCRFCQLKKGKCLSMA